MNCQKWVLNARTIKTQRVHQLFEPSALNVVIFDTVSVHQFPDKAIKNNIFHQSALHATFRLGHLALSAS